MTQFHRLTFDPLQAAEDGRTYALTAHDDQQHLTLQARDVRWQGSHLVGHLTFGGEGEDPFTVPLFSFTDLQARNAALRLVDRAMWTPALNRFCTGIAERQGLRLQDVCLVDLPCDEDEEVTYWPIGDLPPVSLDDISVWFGDGGVGKSFLALYAAGHLALQGFEVLFCDWEMVGERHRRRVRQLFGADEPRGIRYLRCDTPLVQLASDLAPLIHKRRIAYVIVDSVALACHGDAERSEVATAYISAARSLGVGSLHIAHIPKTGAQALEKPFGSVFWHNGARETWSIARAREYDREHAMGLVMQQRKSNVAAPNTRPYALQLVAERRRIYIQPVEIEAGQLLSARERLRLALTEGPLLRDELRARCDALTDATFRQALHREREAGGIFDLNEGLLALNEPPPD